MMKFTPMKYEPVVATVNRSELWWSYVVYPQLKKLKLVDKK